MADRVLTDYRKVRDATGAARRQRPIDSLVNTTLFFQVTHQVMELWMKIWHELRVASTRWRRTTCSTTSRLQRVRDRRVLANQMVVMETPRHYPGRLTLGHGPGIPGSTDSPRLR
jgi:tryptophan 2,3-dioxygenase